MSDTVEKLIQIAAQRFTAEATALRPQDDIFQKLGINSVDALDLLSELEMKFDVEIPDYELQGVHTFEGLAKVIDRRRT